MLEDDLGLFMATPVSLALVLRGPSVATADSLFFENNQRQLGGSTAYDTVGEVRTQIANLVTQVGVRRQVPCGRI